MTKERKIFSETRTINVDGKEIDLIRFYDETNWKIHNWDKPAIRDYSGIHVKKQYFLFGFEYSEEEFKDRVNDRTGLPWYKNPAMKETARF